MAFALGAELHSEVTLSLDAVLSSVRGKFRSLCVVTFIAYLGRGIKLRE